MTYKGQIKYISITKQFAIIQQLWYKYGEKEQEEEIIKFLRADFSLFSEGDIIYYNYTVPFIDYKEEVSFINYED